MKVNAKSIDLAKVQADAEESFRKGFFCCEAVMEVIMDQFQLDMPYETIRLASGMAVGVGKSGCICGAANGGVAALGLLYGRTEQKGPQDPKVVRCMGLTHELHDWFREANKKHALCCRVLTREFDMGHGEHKEQCIWFTGLSAWKVATIICREEGIKNLDEGTEGGDQPYEKTPIAEVVPVTR